MDAYDIDQLLREMELMRVTGRQKMHAECVIDLGALPMRAMPKFRESRS